MSAFKRYLGRHAQNFLAALGVLSRQPLASALTLAVIGIALALPAALQVVVSNGRALAGSWENIRDFSVYLKLGTSQDAAAALAKTLQAGSVVQKVRLITADQALEDIRKDPAFAGVMGALQENPLPNTLVVRPAPDASTEALLKLKTELAARPEVSLVKLDMAWVARLNAILDLLRRAVWIAAVTLAGAVVVIIGNTIRLDIQNRRQEIEVSKLLGASDGFVRRPFLYVGIWYGLLGGVLALAILTAALLLVSGPAARLTALYGTRFQPVGLTASAVLAVLGGGLLAGWVGAWSAVARHLAAIQPRV